MEIKYKYIPRPDIKLETHRDIYQALLDGYCLRNIDSKEVYEKNWILKLANGDLKNVGDTDLGLAEFNSPAVWEVLEEVEVKWYENFQEGDKVICWVGDYEFEKEYVSVVTEIIGLVDLTEVALQFKTETTTWSWAVPVTIEDLQNFNGKFI